MKLFATAMIGLPKSAGSAPAAATGTGADANNPTTVRGRAVSAGGRHTTTVLYCFRIRKSVLLLVLRALVLSGVASDAERRKELGALLRARREQLDRAGYGLPPERVAERRDCAARRSPISPV